MKNNKYRLLVSIPKDIKISLEEAVDRDVVTKGEFVRQALRNFLRSRKWRVRK